MLRLAVGWVHKFISLYRHKKMQVVNIILKQHVWLAHKTDRKQTCVTKMNCPDLCPELGLNASSLHNAVLTFFMNSKIFLVSLTLH